MLYVCLSKNTHLSGCIGSYLQHSRSQLHREGAFVVGHGLFRCCQLGSAACEKLSSLTRGRTHIPCIERQILNHWTTRKSLLVYLFLGFCPLFVFLVHSYHSKRLLFVDVDKNNAAAAAKSLQSCPTLCSPIDGSPPGSAIPGILQARALDWVAISSCQESVCSSVLCLVTTKIWSDGH